MKRLPSVKQPVAAYATAPAKVHSCKPQSHCVTPRDLPQGLQNSVGGFEDTSGAFQEAFVYYADTLFRELGPLVKLWMT